jgi:hypothetical protein
MAITVTQADVDAYRQRHPAAPAFNLAQTLQQLIVIGVDWTLTPDEAAAGLGALLESHAASGGLAFLPIGTATNNTSGESSGHSPANDRDPGSAEPRAPAPGTSALEGLRFALGLADDVLAAGPLPHQDVDDAETSHHMINALYRALAGNYLEEFWGDPHEPSALKRSRRRKALASLREHVTTYLRPAGALQPLRVDTQPYGVLPVLAPSAYAGDDAFESGLARVLDLLRASWTQEAADVQKFDGSSSGTNTLLRHAPWAQAVSYREVERDTIGNAAKEEIEKLQNALRLNPASVFVHLLGATWGAPDALPGTLASYPVIGVTFKPEPSRLPRAMPWVQADAEVKQREAAADARLAPNYIEAIASAIAPNVDTKGKLAGLRKAPSLLQGLLAYSADLEADAANRGVVDPIGAANGMAVSALPQAPRAVGIEWHDSDPAFTSVAHVGELAQLVAPAITGRESVGDFTARSAHELALGGAPLLRRWSDEHRSAHIDPLHLGVGLDTRNLASVKASLLALKERTVGELNWALRTTLDVFDWRLDAWYGSLATRRLAKLRVAAAGERRLGAHVGAYAWVEGLSPDGPRNRESLGHMLTPSLRHAAAAAVLRSGYLANDAAARATFTLDLSSRRVRAARDVFEGLAQGQPLAALIGYRFERELRDAFLAQFMLDYRRKYPFKPPSQPNPGADEEAITARQVTDGVKLLADGVAAAQVVPPGAARDKVQALLADIADLWDAVCDVAVTEGTYQIAQGNMERAAAALAMLDKQATPVEPQSVQSPRDGVSYTQRVALLLDAEAGAPEAWPQDAMSRAEPALNAWLAELIGPPDRFVLGGRAFAGDDIVQELSVDASGLGLSPIALMMSLDAPGGGRTDTQVASAGAVTQPAGAAPVEELSRLRLVLVERLFAQARQQLPGVALRLRVDEVAAQGLGLLQLEALLGLARRLVANARPAVQRDLAVIEGRFDAGAPEGDYPGVDAAELDRRAQAALGELQDAHDALDAALLAADAAAVAAALGACRLFGVAGVEEEGHVERSPEAAAAATQERGSMVRDALAALLARCADLRKDAGAAVGTGALAPIALATLKTVFGRGYAVLPRFRMGVAAAEVQASLDAQDVLTAGRPEAVVGWLPKLAKVRRGVDHLQSLLLAREVLVAPYATERFKVLQSTGRTAGTPRAPWQQPWMALPEAWPQAPEAALLGQAHQHPDLAVALLAPAGLGAVAEATPLTGIVCDDWSETVPLHTVTAAVAFHYDAPGARAPQSLLLAVPPQSGAAAWSFETVLATVREAIELTRLRLVKPAALQGTINLALPLNLIHDSKAPTVASMDFKHLTDVAIEAASSAQSTRVWALGKV